MRRTELRGAGHTGSRPPGWNWRGGGRLMLRRINKTRTPREPLLPTNSRSAYSAPLIMAAPADSSRAVPTREFEVSTTAWGSACNSSMVRLAYRSHSLLLSAPAAAMTILRPANDSRHPEWVIPRMDGGLLDVADPVRATRRRPVDAEIGGFCAGWGYSWVISSTAVVFLRCGIGYDGSTHSAVRLQ
jgi:hypothetical protein